MNAGIAGNAVFVYENAVGHVVDQREYRRNASKEQYLVDMLVYEDVAGKSSVNIHANVIETGQSLHVDRKDCQYSTNARLQNVLLYNEYCCSFQGVHFGVTPVTE